MTHEELTKRAISILKNRTYGDGSTAGGFMCSVVTSEITSVAAETPDAIGWCRGHSVLIECKTSRSDFLADAKKPHRATEGVGERRYFLTEPGLLRPSEIPAEWGLLEVHGRSIRQILKAQKRTLDAHGHAEEKLILLSLIRRINMREFLIISREEADEVLA